MHVESITWLISLVQYICPHVFDFENFYEEPLYVVDKKNYPGPSEAQLFNWGAVEHMQHWRSWPKEQRGL